jgi:hypothetical protein
MSKGYKMWMTVTESGQVVAMFQLLHDATAFEDSMGRSLTVRRADPIELLVAKNHVYDLHTLACGSADLSEVVRELSIASLEQLEAYVSESGYELYLEQSAYDEEEYAHAQDEIVQRLDVVQRELERRGAIA